MCDTMVVMPGATADGSVLFAKNSDRDPNEVHELVMIPAEDHPEAQVQCTYITIPQVKHTFAVFLSKPFWIWGAEMGANEHGVVIGNEAVFSKVPAGKEPGLIGMDFLRLALERGATAAEAAQVIIDLLEIQGQSGNCGYEKPLYYHNSYLIADGQAAYILETVDRDWALKKVEKVASISNRISIQHDYQRCSANLVKQAIDRRWCTSDNDFDFSRCYSDLIYTHFADGRRRSSETYQTLSDLAGEVTEESLFALLRNHRDGFPASQNLTGANVCMHAGYGPVRGSQTTGSMVARIHNNEVTLWVTGTAAPCTSIFKPIWLDSGLPEELNVPATAEFNSSHLWWQHEQLHRAILQDPDKGLPIIPAEQTSLESRFLAQVRTMRNEGITTTQKAQLSSQCFSEASHLTEKWLESVRQMKLVDRSNILYRTAWQKRNKTVHFPPMNSANK